MTEVSRTIDAPPDQVWSLISDLPRMGEWSPECTRCVWRKGATHAEVGAKFRGYNRRGIAWWFTDGEVVAAEAPRLLTFDISSFGMPVARWTYEIERTAEGSSLVTERWEDHRGGLIKNMGRVLTGVADRETHNRAGMEATLDRLAAAASTSS